MTPLLTWIISWIFVFPMALSNELGTHFISNDPSVQKVDNLNLTFRGDYHRAVIHSHKKVVVCYVGTWAHYRTPEEASYELDSIEPSLCTHLIYSFAGLDNNTFTLKPLDPWLDQHLQENGGGKDWYRKFNDFKKQYPHLKVLLAVGGWNEGSIKYSQMASNPKHRQSFIQSSLKLIQRYSFDGLDLDWEFPADRGGSMDDKRHFTTLVRELRTTYDKYGLMLTSAFGPAKSTAEKGYELHELSSLLDHFHIMCYDYHGAWDKKASHNAPLFASKGEGSIDESLNYYLSQGVPASKIVLGLPFYGRTFLLDENDLRDSKGKDAKYLSGLNQPARDVGFQGPYTKEDGFLGFNEICRELVKNRGDWETYWDDIAKVPYMRNGNRWVTFENPDSIKHKVKYLSLKKLRGAMIWSIDTDDFRGSCGVKNPLLRTVNFALYQNSVPDSAPGGRPTSGTEASGGMSTMMAMIIATLMIILIL